jgi:hypothetical protein
VTRFRRLTANQLASANEIEELLGGIDLEKLAGTERAEDVIEAMTLEDLDWDESQTTDVSRKVLTVILLQNGREAPARGEGHGNKSDR